MVQSCWNVTFQTGPRALCALDEQPGLCPPGSGCHGRFCLFLTFYSQEVALRWPQWDEADRTAGVGCDCGQEKVSRVEETVVGQSLLLSAVCGGWRLGRGFS